MNFDEIQVIWDEQKHERQFRINEDSLQKLVIKKRQGVSLMAARFEISMIFIFVVMGIITIVEGIMDREFYQVPQGLLLFIVAGFLIWDRRVRKELEINEPETMLAEIDHALSVLNHHIKRQQNFTLWFITPLVINCLIQMYFTIDSKPWWIWPVVCLTFVIAYWMVRRELNSTTFPAKKELEALQRLLLQ